MSADGKPDLVAELAKLGARDPESARLMGMIVALAGEVFVLKALGLTAPKRVGAYPDLPVIAETPGLAGFEATGWFALYAPAGTPKAIVDQLNAVLTAAVNGADLRNRLTAMGLEPATSSPEGLAAFQRSENVKWQKVVAEAKIKVE